MAHIYIYNLYTNVHKAELHRNCKRKSVILQNEKKKKKSAVSCCSPSYPSLSAEMTLCHDPVSEFQSDDCCGFITTMEGAF